VLPTEVPASSAYFTLVEITSVDTSQGVTGVYMECTSADSCIVVPKTNNARADNAAVKVKVGEWHHIALVIVRGVSGGTISIYIDGKATPLSESTFLAASSSPASVEFGGGTGGGYVGLVDEVKLWSKHLSLLDFIKQPAGAMFSRDPAVGSAISSGLVGYYRFNRGLVMELKATDATQAAVMSVGAAAVLEPGPVPWEPAVMYSVDGVETGAQAMSAELKTVPNSGGVASIAVMGFNFAPSQWLKCAWGVVVSAPGVAFAAPAAATAVANGCPAVGEAELGRVDGMGLYVGPYAVGEMPGAAVEVKATRGAGALAATSLTCLPPATAAVGLHMFGVANPRMLATVPFEAGAYNRSLFSST